MGCYIVTILKTKTKLIHLVIHYISCKISFHMVTNVISCMYEVLSNPSLHFCIRHHVSNFIRVICAINLKCIFNILRRLWAFSLALDSTTH